MNAEKEFRDDSNETSCFCKFRLKADGKFDETSFRISSFPWAINRVKQKQIELNQWDDDFHEYEKRLFMQLFAWDEVVDYEKCRQIVNQKIFVGRPSETLFGYTLQNCFFAECGRVEGDYVISCQGGYCVV